VGGTLGQTPFHTGRKRPLTTKWFCKEAAGLRGRKKQVEEKDQSHGHGRNTFFDLN
jgi:hypothetical protein